MDESKNRRAEDKYHDPTIALMQAQLHEITKSVAFMNNNEKNAFEKHMQTIFGALAILLLGWFGLSVADSREDIVRLTAATTAMEARVSELKSDIKDAINNNYTKHDALKDIELVMSTIRSIETRVYNLETSYNKNGKEVSKDGS